MTRYTKKYGCPEGLDFENHTAHMFGNGGCIRNQTHDVQETEKKTNTGPPLANAGLKLRRCKVQKLTKASGYLCEIRHRAPQARRGVLAGLLGLLGSGIVNF